jgi:hypothetical protein
MVQIVLSSSTVMTKNHKRFAFWRNEGVDPIKWKEGKINSQLGDRLERLQRNNNEKIGSLFRKIKTDSNVDKLGRCSLTFSSFKHFFFFCGYEQSRHNVVCSQKELFCIERILFQLLLFKYYLAFFFFFWKVAQQ